MEITHRSMSDEAYQIIRFKIVENELHFGERLYIDRLAEELGVSATPVREALNRMTAGGLTDYRSHKGIYLFDPCEQDIKDLCQARLCLERELAATVVEQISPQQLQTLHECADPEAYSSEPGKGREWGFHHYYVQFSGNRTFQRLHHQVTTLVELLFAKAQRSPLVADEAASYKRQHYREEEAICQAIEARDVEAVQANMATHTNNLRDFLLRAKVVRAQ